MPKLRVHNLSMSLDGYAAGPDQSLEHPLGVRGEELHKWAFAASGGDDVRIGGGPSTIQQYVQAGLVDELHVVIVPVLFGAGQRLLEPFGGQVEAFEVSEVAASPESQVTHVQLVRR